MNDRLQETIQQIEKQLDEALIQRLTLHAASKLDRLWWQGVLGGDPPGGLKAMDFVQGAIEKTLKPASGSADGRRWDFVAQPDLLRHLQSVIDSDVSHLVQGWENSKFRSEEALSPVGSDGESAPFLESIQSHAASPSEICVESEQEHAREKVLFEFFDSLADDPQVQKTMELIFDGISKPAAQATKLGLTPKEMYVVTRRMQRRIEQFKEKRAKLLAEARAHV